jgi:hypothetical protein
MTAHQGRGKSLEAWVAGELAAAERVGLLLHARQLYPKVRAFRGKLIPAGDAPPDFLAVLQDGTAVYCEAKEMARDRFPFEMVQPHQASDLSALPGSLVVVRWTESPPLTVALPWAALGPLWREHAGRTGRAKPGEGSLSLDQALELGREVGTGAQALGWAIVDAARDAARRVA